MKRGFTLIEMVVVVVIIGILAIIAVPLYRLSVLRVQERDARIMLKMVQAAEKMQNLDTDYYITCDSSSSCNAKLDLNLSVADSRKWDYTVTLTADDFCVQASRRKGYGKDEPKAINDYHITAYDSSPTEGKCL